MELLLSPKCFCRNWAVTMCSLNIRSMLIRRSCPTYFKKVYSSQTTRVARVSAASLGCPQVVSISQPQHRSSVAMAALEMTDERQSTEVDISMGASSTCEEPSQLDGGKGGGMSHIEEEAEEAKHYFEVAQSFFEYSLFMRPEIERRRRQVAQLASHHKALLPMDAMEAKQVAFIRCTEANQRFFDAVIEFQRMAGSAYPLPRFPDRSPAALARRGIPMPTTAARHFSKAKSTLHQLVREWGVEGQAERDSCYGVLLEQLKRWLPVTEHTINKQRVLCPGSGLGRLPLEVAAAGYLSQGNEFSYQMLMTGLFMLNGVERARCCPIHPWIHNPNNAITPEDLLRVSLIPDASAEHILGRNTGPVPPGEQVLSMVAGEFLEVYGKQQDAWDAVVSCFFLDTAPNIIEYLEVVKQILRPGGYLINFGPLLYHWQGGGEADPRYDKSIELSYAELKHVMQAMGFTILHEHSSATSYCKNIRSLMGTYYTGMCFVAQKTPPVTASATEGSSIPTSADTPAATSAAETAAAGATTALPTADATVDGATDTAGRS